MDKETMILAINSKFEELKTALEGDELMRMGCLYQKITY